MSEKINFRVDERGYAESVNPSDDTSNSSTEFAPGMVIGKNRKIYFDPTSPEAEANGQYFIDEGGRVIDIRTGACVTQGDGQSGVSFETLDEYEKQNQ